MGYTIWKSFNKMMHISIKMSLRSTTISISLCYIISLIFGLFNFLQGDWITFGTESYGMLSLDHITGPFWEWGVTTEFLPSVIFIYLALAFSFVACVFCVEETIKVTKGKSQDKKSHIGNSQDKKSREQLPTFPVYFSISVLCYVIGLAIWTHEICNRSFSKEHFSGEHCSNFNWNFSYFAGWISTVFLLFCTICSCCWRQFVK